MASVPSKRDFFEARAKRHGAELQGKLAGSTVAICGLGGLGSIIAVSLARMGVGHLILVDFDRVDLTNLHRQQYKFNQIGMHKTRALAANLAEIDPFLEVTLHTCRISEENLEEILKDADVICEAFDQAEEKAMLVNGVFEHFPQKYLVAASGMAGLGPADLIHTRQVTSHFVICGDEVSDVANEVSLTAPRVMVCAGHEALAAVKFIADFCQQC